MHFPFFLARPSAGTRHSHKLFFFLKKGSPSPLSICEKRVVRLQWSHKEGRRGLFITEAKSGEMRPLYPQEKEEEEKHSCIFATGKTVWETQLLFFFPFLFASVPSGAEIKASSSFSCEFEFIKGFEEEAGEEEEAIQIKLKMLYCPRSPMRENGGGGGGNKKGIKRDSRVEEEEREGGCLDCYTLGQMPSDLREKDFFRV